MQFAPSGFRPWRCHSISHSEKKQTPRPVPSLRLDQVPHRRPNLWEILCGEAAMTALHCWHSGLVIASTSVFASGVLLPVDCSRSLVSTVDSILHLTLVHHSRLQLRKGLPSYVSQSALLPFQRDLWRFRAAFIPIYVKLLQRRPCIIVSVSRESVSVTFVRDAILSIVYCKPLIDDSHDVCAHTSVLPSPAPSDPCSLVTRPSLK